MATELQNPTDQSATSLVGGIIDDMHDLVKQQVQLTRKEITEEVHKASEAAQLYLMGGAILLLGLVFVGFTLVHLLHWVLGPAAADASRLPLWACHAAVGGPLTIIGGVMTWMGRETLRSINPLHNAATDALKENVKWATNAK
jgi:hypothetical protein